MFTKESFEVIQVTDIPRSALLPQTVTHLMGRELMVDVDKGVDERLYSGDVFAEIAGEFEEIRKMGISTLSQELIDEVDVLADLIETELIRLI